MAYLVLSNGTVFEGQRIGAPVDCIGELVFTTGVVGYMETLTDPNYTGQIVLQTFPQIGNYGVMEEDAESSCTVSGYVVRELCDQPSNFRSQGDLDTFLKRKGIGGICGVDTRQLTRILRDEGVMTACICDEVPKDLSALQNYRVSGVVEQVSNKESVTYPATGDKCFRVTLVDYGVKRSLVQALCDCGCEVTVVPWDTPAESILAAAPDGVVLSDGPGDPAENAACIEQIRQLMGRVPVLGIGLGHQMTALAMGGQCQKLPYGHRGANQPVRQVGTARTFVTGQNHGYTVMPTSVNEGEVTFVNVNDGSCEGLNYPRQWCMTLQFQPDNDNGPQGTAFLYDTFITMMGGDADAEG